MRGLGPGIQSQVLTCRTSEGSKESLHHLPQNHLDKYQVIEQLNRRLA